MSFISSPKHPQLDMEWVHTEVAPFFVSAYAADELYQGYSICDWEEYIKKASHDIDTLPIYEDFESTVERVRMMLINPGVMTPAEMKDFSWIRDHPDICATIFVRHAIRHGTFKIASLGPESDPDHPRRSVIDDGYIYGGKFAGRPPSKTGKVVRRRPLVPGLISRGHLSSPQNRCQSVQRGGVQRHGSYNGSGRGQALWPDQVQESLRYSPGVRIGRGCDMSSSGGTMQPTSHASRMVGRGSGKSSFNYGGTKHPRHVPRPTRNNQHHQGQQHNQFSPPTNYVRNASPRGQNWAPYLSRGQHHRSRFGTNGINDMNNAPRGVGPDSRSIPDENKLRGDAPEFKQGGWPHGT